MLPKVLVVLVFILIALGGYTIYSNSQNKTSPLLNPVNPLSALSPTPTPGPFDDLTIPYLRNREYKSSLGELEQVSENANYTSYLTSYTSDGLKINAQLTRPKGEMPEGGWSAVIFIHGYIPPSSYQTLINYSSYVDYLARNGLVVFKIDLRGHGESEGEGGGAYYSSDYVIDTLSAHFALQGSGFVNPERIGLWGHSMAGNVALRSIAVKPEIPAAVIWAGAGFSYVDLNQFGIDDNSYRPPQDASERQRKRQLLREMYGNPIDGNPFWKLVAPTSYLEDLKGAIALHHAADDNVVDIGYSRNLNDMLNKTSVIHELNEYSSGGHNLTGSSFNQAMQKTVDFFKEHL